MNNIITFGENHTNKNEISEIRNKILEIKPDIILHELDWEDRDFYKSNIPGVKILPLEPSNKKSYDYPSFNTLSIKLQFLIRENEMLNVIINTIKSNKNKTIVIVIGDTHLRTVSGNYFYTESLISIYISEIGGKIIRSNIKEID